LIFLYSSVRYEPEAKRVRRGSYYWKGFSNLSSFCLPERARTDWYERRGKRKLGIPTEKRRLVGRVPSGRYVRFQILTEGK